VGKFAPAGESAPRRRPATQLAVRTKKHKNAPDFRERFFYI
jgi:hypothetical protein